MLTRSFNTKVEGQLATLLDRQQSLQTSIPAAIDIYQKDTQAHIVAQTKSLICLQGDTPDDILTRLKRIENGDVHQRRSLSRAIGAVESLSATVHSSQSKLHDRLNSLEAIMQRSTTLESPQDLTGSDAICRAVRAEMRNIMLSLADDVAGSETWRKDLFTIRLILLLTRLEEIYNSQNFMPRVRRLILSKRRTRASLLYGTHPTRIHSLKSHTANWYNNEFGLTNARLAPSHSD